MNDQSKTKGKASTVVEMDEYRKKEKYPVKQTINTVAATTVTEIRQPYQSPAVEEKKPAVTLQMLGTNIVVTRVKTNQKTETGLYIPETAQAGGQCMPAMIHSISETMSNELNIQVGDKVLIPSFLYNNRTNGAPGVDDSIVLQDQDILAKVTE